MKFIHSKYPTIRYTVRPDTKTHWGPSQTENVPGLHAQFRQSMFDSEVAQRESIPSWSDIERIEVEQHLLHHIDFGITLQTVDDVSDIKTGDADTRPFGSCQQMVMTDEGVHKCEAKIETEGELLCPKHIAKLAEATA